MTSQFLLTQLIEVNSGVRNTVPVCLFGLILKIIQDVLCSHVINKNWAFGSIFPGTCNIQIAPISKISLLTLSHPETLP